MAEKATPTTDISKLLEIFGNMKVNELNELISAVEEKFDVQAVVPVAGNAAVSEVAPQQEKTTFSVFIKEVGGAKVPLIKAVNTALALGSLMNAKKLIDEVEKNPKKALIENVDKEKAEQIKTMLEENGAIVELG